MCFISDLIKMKFEDTMKCKHRSFIEELKARDEDKSSKTFINLDDDYSFQNIYQAQNGDGRIVKYELKVSGQDN